MLRPNWSALQLYISRWLTTLYICWRLQLSYTFNDAVEQPISFWLSREAIADEGLNNSERSSAWSAERSDFIVLSRAQRERSLLTARGLSQLRNSRLHKSLYEYMLGVRQWRHGAFCVSRQHGLRRRWPRRILMCIFIVSIGESQTISHANDTQAQQVAPNPRPGRFPT